MAAVTSSIGSITGLIYLRRIDAPDSPPPSEHQAVVPMQRPGVEGTAFVLQGDKGNVFQMESLAVVANLAAALALESTYKALIGTSVYITWGGTAIDYAMYTVLDVQVLTAHKAPVATSGGAYRRAVWTLIPIAYVAP